MESRIESRPATVLVGLSFYGDPFSQSAGWTEENEIGVLWTRFMKRREESRDSFPPFLGPEELYELHIPDPGTAETGQYEVFIGYAIAYPLQAPPELLVKVLPPSTYARFTLTGDAIVDRDSYVDMYAWIESEGLTPAHEWMFNLYDSRFKSLTRLGESELDVCIPVR